MNIQVFWEYLKEECRYICKQNMGLKDNYLAKLFIKKTKSGHFFGKGKMDAFCDVLDILSFLKDKI
jgi:hypothetical protein